MPITTAEEFLTVLERSNLLSPVELAEARELSANNPDATQLAKALARNQIITFWQAGHLLQGRSSFVLGRYRLIELLGRGGMGSVFLASHIVMQRKVALKFIPARIAENPAALERFLAEARTVAALDHPNIVRAYSVDNEGKRYYLVMEYVDGIDLQRAVEAYGPLDCQAVVDFMRQAADGLSHAHARNMIHCDIKPPNLIVTEEGVVKILDMGLARLVKDKAAGEETNGAESGSANNQILGSVDYLAPEQALCSPDFNHRADIYSLGCTMYFLLTGHPPFPTGTLAQRIVKHQTQEPVDVAKERPEVPANLAAICRKMMAKDPAERYQTAAEVRDVLAAWAPEVPQPAKKAIAIKKIEPIKDLRAVSPWEQEFGEELKNLAGTSGAHDFGMPPGMSGKMPAVKSGSSSVKLKKILAGTRQRLIITSCTIAVCIVFLAGGIILSLIYGGKANQGTGTAAQPLESEATNTQPPNLPPPPAPVVATDSTAKVAPETIKKAPVGKEKKKRERKKRATPPAPVNPPTPDTPATQKLNPTVANVEATPEAQPEGNNPPVEATPPEPAPTIDSLNDLLTEVELPEIKTSNGSGGSSSAISLGKVNLLDAKVKVQMELIGGDRVAKGFVYTLQEDQNAVGGQAWNISRSDIPIARITLKRSKLTFDWAQIPALQANPLRNCGVAITAGDASRFVQFRVRKSAVPLVLDLKGAAAAVKLPVDNLPDLDRLKLRVEDLAVPLPAHNINAEVLLSKGERAVDITFNDPNLSAFLIRVIYDPSKRTSIDLNTGGYYSSLANKLRFATAEKFLMKAKTELASKERQFNETKNPTAKANVAAQVDTVKTRVQQGNEILGLMKKLHGQTIHYQIVLDYDKYQVVLFDSHPPAAKKSEVANKAP